jgi:two-component system, response regulator YesN
MYKILVVDDEVLVRVGLKTTIDWEANGFSVVAEASNGEQGYEQYKKHLPDVIITDIKMPKKDGLWLLEKVKNENRQVKVVMLTCYDEFDYARKALKMGANDYILKSEVEDEELIAIMQTIKKKLDDENKAKNMQDKMITNQNDIKRTVLNDMIKMGFHKDIQQQDRCLGIEFPLDNTKFAFLYFSLEERGVEKSLEPDNVGQTHQAILNLLFDLLAERSVGYVFNNHMKTYYLFLLSSPSLNNEELNRILTSLKSGAKQYFNMGLSPVCSDIVNDFNELGSSYKNFMEKTQVLFYKSGNDYFIENTSSIKFKEPNIFSIKKEYNNRLLEALGQRNIGEVNDIINEIGTYFEKSLVNPMLVRACCSNLIMDIISNYSYFLEDNQRIESHEHYHYQLMNSEHLKNIMMILTEFTKIVIEEITRMKNHNPKGMVNLALNYIQEHYDEKISLEDVANKLNVSKHYLCSIFKKETGENMSLYINKLRIEKSKRMLLEPQVRIKEIFEEVGYSNQHYFSKVFKKVTGMTVLEYREKRIQNNGR